MVDLLSYSDVINNILSDDLVQDEKNGSSKIPCYNLCFRANNPYYFFFIRMEKLYAIYKGSIDFGTNSEFIIEDIKYLP